MLLLGLLSRQAGKVAESHITNMNPTVICTILFSAEVSLIDCPEKCVIRLSAGNPLADSKSLESIDSEDGFPAYALPALLQ
jgi:hypothetical protein